MSDVGLNLTEAELREGLHACLAVPRWVDEVMASAPYASVAALLDVAGRTARSLSADEVDQALSRHPRIGERLAGTGRAAVFSRAEHRSDDSEDVALAAALAAANRAYEERFGRIFLIRAAGRSRADVVAEAQRRLHNDPETELTEVAGELREIALLRIPHLFPHLDHHSGYDDSDAAR